MARIVLRGRGEAISRALTALRHAARTGQGAVVAISGEPGIGKSAVLRDVVEQASRTGFRVGTGKAEQGDQIAPGAPLLVALRSGPQPLLTGDSFTSLAPLYDKPLWLVDRISGLLEELAEHGPVLVAIDDVQWADRLTRFALRVLPARLAGSPVVWAVASRRAPSDALDEILAGTDDVTTTTRIPLGPLTADDIAELATDRMDGAPSAQLLDLLEEAGGNPFWAVQVIDGLARRPGEPKGPSLYAELARGIRGRLDDLSESGVALIRLAAVWGRFLAATDATRLLGHISDAQLALLTKEAVDNGLLASGLSANREGGVYFPHDLLRETVYADIAPEERRALHRACARHITGEGGSVLSAAVHFRASARVDDEEAIVALERAARDSESLPDQALDIAQHAFALTSPDHPLWFLTGERTVEALLNAQREGEALKLADRLLGKTVDAETASRLELLACRALWRAGDGIEMEQRAAAALERDDISAVLRARLFAAQALGSSRAHESTRTEAMIQQALAEGNRLGDNQTRRFAVVASIEAARNEGRHRLALERFAGLRRLSDDAYIAEEIRTLQHLDRFDDAEAMLAKIRDAHDDVDRQLPSMLYAQMWQDLNLAQFDAAEAGARTLLRLVEETGNHAYRLNGCMVLAVVCGYRGELDKATSLLAPTDQHESLHETRSPRLRLMHGWLKASTGDFEGSLALLTSLLEPAGEFRDPWLWTPPWLRILAHAGAAAGDPSFAERAAHLADLAAQRNPGVASLEGAALHIRGLLAGDVGALLDAVRVLRNSPRPMLVADALKDLGAAQLDQDLSDAGVRSLTEAADIYQRVGAVSGTRAVSAVLRRHGVRGVRVNPSTPRPSSGWASLTPTEMRVVSLISTGHTNRSAATELGVSANTVNTHLRAVFRKLEVRSRVQLTIAFREQSGGVQ
jgi:DNA-binding CsgD family transcriptional regulator